MLVSVIPLPEKFQKECSLIQGSLIGKLNFTPKGLMKFSLESSGLSIYFRNN